MTKYANAFNETQNQHLQTKKHWISRHWILKKINEIQNCCQYQLIMIDNIGESFYKLMRNEPLSERPFLACEDWLQSLCLNTCWLFEIVLIYAFRQLHFDFTGHNNNKINDQQEKKFLSGRVNFNNHFHEWVKQLCMYLSSNFVYSYSELNFLNTKQPLK